MNYGTIPIQSHLRTRWGLNGRKCGRVVTYNRFKIFDSWRLFATENNDTTYNERRLIFTLDTNISVDWGSEEQTMQKSYLTDGIVTQDYEWRKYGLIVKIHRDGQRVKMDYIFRDKDNSVSVLQGS